MKKKKVGKSLTQYLRGKVKDADFRITFEETSMHFKIARLIETLRLKSGMTQAQLAKKAGVSQPMIARMERGDQDRVPTLSTINKVLKALGHEMDLLIKKVA